LLFLFKNLIFCCNAHITECFFYLFDIRYQNSIIRIMFIQLQLLMFLGLLIIVSLMVQPWLVSQLNGNLILKTHFQCSLQWN